MNEEQLFFGILQEAIGAKESNAVLTNNDWASCFKLALKHNLTAIVFPVVQKKMLGENGKRIEPLYSEWLSVVVQTDYVNRNLDEKAKMLSRILISWGFNSCILKGQGIARLYPEPLLRQGGDIDIWVNGDQSEIVKCLQNHFIGITDIDYIHSGITIFNDAVVEVHFRPSWMCNPFTNKKLQEFFKKCKKRQFDHIDGTVGFAYPTISFNLVYSIIHIYRHIFAEGIGLRQLLDYYYILQHSNNEERNDAFNVLCDLGLRKYIGAIMYIEGEVFAIEREIMLCAPNVKEGIFLLGEILRGGNFGRYDERNKWFAKDRRIGRGLFNLKRNIRYLTHYPSEVLWIPFWKIWHWCWRKWKGYL